MPSLSFGLLAAPLLSGLFPTVAGLPSGRPVQVRDAFTRLGCFTDTDAAHRALAADFKGDDTMTVEMCAEYCSAYQFFGIEYGRECYCGNERDAGSLTAPDADCSFACPGDASETCGAGSRIEIYTNNGYTPPTPPAAPAGAPYLGCFVDSAERALPDRIVSEADMTAAKCAANCDGYAYFGTQWSSECYCGNTAPTETAPESDCNMQCSGDATELCGAGMRLSVYGPVGSTTPPPVVETPNPATVGDYVYDGCYTDSIALRVLSGDTISSDDMTLASCAAICSGYSYFGVEFGIQCFCGTTLDPSGVKSPETDCTIRCPGDDSLICGDANRLTVYKKTAVPDAPSNLATVGAFKYQSCWTDAVGARSLQAKDEARSDMTVEICAAFCDGYAFFGVEYATECYCGNELAGGETAAEEDCSQLCAGNPSQWCGGASRINLYAVNPFVVSSSSALPDSTTSASETTDIPDPETTSSAPEATDVSETTTTSAPTEATTTSPPEATDAPTTDVPSTTFAATSTAVDEQTATITPAPVLTTVTTCGGLTRVAGQSSCYWKLPGDCTSLSSTSMEWFDAYMAIDSCTGAFDYALSSVVSTCFPDFFDEDGDANTIYSCLTSAAVCSSTTACATNTYTVGQEPTITGPVFPSATPFELQNPGFETGTLDGWTKNPYAAPFNAIDVSGARVHSGSMAMRAVFLNDNGRGDWYSQTMQGVPGGNYTLSMWVSHDNPTGSNCIVNLVVQPVVTYPQNGLDLRGVPAGGWNYVSIDFQTAASWTTLSFLYSCEVTGGIGAASGKNTLYFDDFALVSRDA